MLQRKESDIVLNRVCAKLDKTYPHTPLYTIHDSITTTEPFAELVQNTLSKELKAATGIDPTLKIKKWTVNNNK